MQPDGVPIHFSQDAQVTLSILGETPRESPALMRNNHSSPSNSTNSLERVGTESVTALHFIQSCSKRNGTHPINLKV